MLTRQQKDALTRICQSGFEGHHRFSTGQKNKPLWALVDAGLASFEWGPSGSVLKVQGFVPTDAGRLFNSKGTTE